MGGRARRIKPASRPKKAGEHPVHRHIGDFGGGIDHLETPVHDPGEDDGIQDALEHFFGAVGSLFDALGDALDRDSD